MPGNTPKPSPWLVGEAELSLRRPGAGALAWALAAKLRETPSPLFFGAPRLKGPLEIQMG
eukprot:3186918-Alexandrium_andersonii.AAC.1